MAGKELFHTPASEWTEAELQAGVRVVIDARNAASTAGDLPRADAWNDVLYVLANERSTPAQLYQETGKTVEYNAFEDDTSNRPISDLLRLDRDDPEHVDR